MYLTTGSFTDAAPFTSDYTFQHIYYRKLTPRQLREALAHFMDQNMRWDTLLNPFTRMGVFRQRTHQLQTIVVRLATFRR